MAGCDSPDDASSSGCSADVGCGVEEDEDHPCIDAAVLLALMEGGTLVGRVVDEDSEVVVARVVSFARPIATPCSSRKIPWSSMQQVGALSQQ